MISGLLFGWEFFMNLDSGLRGLLSWKRSLMFYGMFWESFWKVLLVGGLGRKFGVINVLSKMCLIGIWKKMVGCFNNLESVIICWFFVCLIVLYFWGCIL